LWPGDAQVPPVILINLLPHREARRRARGRNFFLGVALSAVAGVGLVAAGLSGLTQLSYAQEERNAYLKTEISRLDGQIKDIASLRAEIDALKARLKSIEDLQTDRNIPVHLLNEVARLTPEGLHLRSLVQTGADVVLTGVAQSNERVSELLRNVSVNGEWLERPELIEVKSGLTDISSREKGRVYEFSVRLNVKRPAAEPVPKRPAGPASS
jgi:type IV pilus assembly protein PilN